MVIQWSVNWWNKSTMYIKSPYKRKFVNDLYQIALSQVTDRVKIDFLNWGFYTLWQTPLVWGKFSSSWGCHLSLVEKPDMCWWFVKITGLTIGWSDFGKVDQSGEVLFLIISNNPLFKFSLISSVGSIFYFGSISSTLNYWTLCHVETGCWYPLDILHMHNLTGEKYVVYSAQVKSES